MSHAWTIVPVTLVTLAALVPASRPRLAATASFWLGYLVNEFPFFAFCWLVVATLLALGNASLDSTVGLAVLGLAVLTVGGLVLVMRRALEAGPTIAAALRRDLGGGSASESASWLLDRPVPARTVLWPVPIRPRDVHRITNVSYGSAGRRHRFDLYRHRSCPAGAPVLIHFHGGHFRTGRKSREARGLFYRLAARGWVCVSANYRLGAAGQFPASLIDAKRVIAWVREHATEYALDPSLVVVAGSSAGAHLASMAALTPNDPAFQPGFDSLDTSVSAAVCLYGYYGNRDTASRLRSSPHAYIHKDAPPFFVAHGGNDTLVPVASGASFADALRSVSLRPVVYAELAGAQHAFDLLQSVRFERVVEGVGAFTDWVRAHGDPSSAQRAPLEGASATLASRPLGRGRGFRPSLLRAIRLGVPAVAVALLLSACGGSASTPRTTLAQYLAAWGRGDWTAMRSQVTNPPADFTTVNSEAFRALGVTHASFAAGRITVAESKDSATARVGERFILPHVGVWAPVTTVHVVKRDGTWRVLWAPATVNPTLKAGDKLAVRKVWLSRAPITGAGGTAMTRRAPLVVIGVVGGRIKDKGAVRADLLIAGASGTQVSEALTQAATHPNEFEPVFTVPLARFDQLKSQPAAHNVYAVPGTQFERTSARAALTAQLAAHVVGSLGPITAQELQTNGAPYDASSTVGQTGIEASQERILAGDPSTHIDVEDASGNPIKLLASFGGHPGAAVRISIDPRVQRAAESALAQSKRPDVSMVAIRASTGQVLAVVADPLSTYDTALQGAYPPGSTFKVLTFTALYGHGLTPASPASCPSTLTVNGQSFHNASGVGPASTIADAFTESCNTAFISLAIGHLSPADLPTAAQLYGLARTPQLGLPAFSANVPEPSSQNELAADAIGQGRLTFSPLGMAQVAAAIDSGVVRAPRLVDGAPDDTQPPSRLPTGLLTDLRAMMAEVTTTGTAAGTGLPVGTHAKTGTAEYGTGAESHVKIDGWLMGYFGDIAFAIVTHDTGGPDGGPVDGPLIAKFLNQLGPGA